MLTGAVIAIGATVVALFAVAAIEDATTERVRIRLSQLITVVAVAGFSLVSVVASSWTRLLSALAGAAIVVGVQAIPYWRQARAGTKSRATDRIGKADVRLGVPFGWTLGWFDVGYAVVGFALALALGVLYSLATRRTSVPFVPFLTAGLALGVGLGVAALVESGLS